MNWIVLVFICVIVLAILIGLGVGWALSSLVNNMC